MTLKGPRPGAIDRRRCGQRSGGAGAGTGPADAVDALESGGYRVDVVGDGVDAVSAVRARRYDAVLMDCHMPRMDGFQAALTIRVEEGGFRRAPIIALTAGAMPEDRARCLAAGMDDHLPKPFKKVDLLAEVARWAPC